MRHGVPIFGLGLLLSTLLAAAAGHTQGKPPELTPTCGQQGRVIFDASATLLDAGGRPLARFSGGESAVTLLAPPTEASRLAKIETGTGRGSFRLRGWVEPSELRIYTRRSVPIVSAHVWLDAGTRVTLAGSSGGKVRLEKQVTTPFDQRFSASVECSALTFTPPTPPGFSMPGAARVFLMKGPELPLFGAVPPTGAALLTLRRAAQVDNVRFFSTEQRGGFVHVKYHGGEVNVDAWARADELTPLPRGEAAELPPSSFSLSSPPQLQLSPLPKTVKTSRELPLRLAARDAEAAVGVIEADTELFVMDTITGWTKVLPKSLHVLPVGEQSFWVKTADLGS